MINIKLDNDDSTIQNNSLINRLRDELGKSAGTRRSEPVKGKRFAFDKFSFKTPLRELTTRRTPANN